jgi:uncharacterized membrane protein YeaQ/YmgE (transglycosylase-associated protein family)
MWGWILAIIVGGVAGWIAEQIMRSEMGLVMNIVLGIIGALVLNAALAFFWTPAEGETTWLWQLIAGVVGACILIAVFRMVRGKPAR